jgi:phosphate transport system substrate-binding protein
VLVVVAIAGAAAVGTIMGSFSSEVSDDANVGDAATASSTELLIAGSTTVQPVSELLAEAYMEEHPGVKVTVQGGGSGSGVASAGMGIVDIGAASRDPKDSELEEYPDIQTYQIGASAVVIIANHDLGLTNVSQAELYDAYVNGTDPATLTNLTGVDTLYQRSEESGTEDTFVDWLGDYNESAEMNETATEGATGNAGVLEAVQGNDKAIGFVDYGYADGADGVDILGIYDNAEGKMYGQADVTGSNIKDELADQDGEHYATGLTRPLNYLTNGEPSAIENAFITFARSPGSIEYFEKIGYFSVLEY